MNLISHIVAAWILTISFSAFGLSQQDKLTTLRSYIPASENGKLTPELLVKITLTAATRTKTIQSELIAKDQDEMKINGLFDTTITSTATQARDQSQKGDPAFGPDEADQTKYTIGARKLFQTGTSISSSMQLSDIDRKWPAGPQFSQYDSREKEATFEILIQQSLWRNSLGRTFSRMQQAASLASSAVEFSVRENLEMLTLATLGQYYEVWLKRELVKIAKKSLATQTRLFKMIEKQYELGVSEKPDYIDSKVNLELAKNRVSLAKLNFYEKWKILVISLKLSDSILDINPKLIPLNTDKPVPHADAICSDDIETVNGYPSLELDKLKKQKAAMDTQVAISKEKILPDAYIQASSSGNSLDDDWGKGTSQSLAAKNHTLAIVLGIEVNLGNNSNKSEILGLLQLKKQLDLALDDFGENRKIEWINLCDSLKTQKRTANILARGLTSYRERLKLQEKRFKLGRISAFDLYQAQAAVNSTMNDYLTAKYQLLGVAWKLRKLRGDIPGYIKEIMSKPLENTTFVK